MKSVEELQAENEILYKKIQDMETAWQCQESLKGVQIPPWFLPPSPLLSPNNASPSSVTLDFKNKEFLVDWGDGKNYKYKMDEKYTPIAFPQWVIPLPSANVVSYHGTITYTTLSNITYFK
jgi:hypothetical protein